MLRSFLLTFFLTSIAIYTSGQPDLSYYLPEGVTYDPAIPTPKSIIGHEVGEWHVTHDRLVNYMYALDKASDRVTLEVTGHTYEGRPLLLLTITSPKNHQNLEAIRSQHVQLADPAKSSSLDTKNMPAVFYIGFSIHGNEASGVNAGLLAAYHFAAAKGKDIESYLDNTIILFDPSYNPDGMQRFSSWVNSRKSQVISTDPNDTEHNEAWPGGRFNHYWFDLNRDWLVAQHPESQARVKSFQKWKPNVLTDHHEMGTNATFFFQPGVPSRMHPLTPEKNLELTKRIGEFHAKALDEIGSFYYTQEGYDDFYYGKGSTFPDVQGSIGILFEQASSRGHSQESINGVLTFPFTVRNQFTTALSSLKAVNTLREDLLNYQRQFFKDAVAEAAKDPVKAYLFGSSKDPVRAFYLAEIIARQNVDIYKVGSNQTVNGKTYVAASSYVVPMNQAQYKLIKGMFEKRSTFKDSLFYDISSWTLPLAFGLDYEELKATPAFGEKLTTPKMPEGKRVGGKSEYAYVFESYGYYAPRAIYRILSHGLRLKVASDPFYSTDGRKFDRGALLLEVGSQEKNADQIEFIVNEIVSKDGIDVYAFNTGLDYKGVSLGSGSFLPLKKPVIGMLVGDGISPTDVGEVWHMLDTRFQIPVSLIPVNVFDRTNLNKYNTLILPPTVSTPALSEATKEKLKAWTQAGGVIIGLENSVTWLTNIGLGRFDMKKEDEKKDAVIKPRPYGDIDEYTGAQETSGAIFEATVDLTHPLLYGYTNARIPIFKSNNLFMEKAKNAYGNPVVFTASPLISGYISKQNYGKVKESAVAGVTAYGQGRVVGFTDNLCFRAFWLGSNKMLMNAIYYGPLISNTSSR
ncbi:M14 family metallopeptidase [Chryseolinea lacunae]|uniref:Zinc carboxypeptidase n=1 Tax=Chryseolinea lacunae TaxID=2801331 RepID=A0ABS1KVQ8_9BACT|nr:M14 family metallopeptidase [Chryseolinea lacunae]MBL0743393.1 zinc carboxypeptidase [Chryseolinea lacunae]